MNINTVTGEINLKGFTFNKSLSIDDLEDLVKSNNGDFRFSCKRGSEDTYIIDFNDNEYIYNVRFRDGKIILFIIEYLAFSNNYENYVAKKDERVKKTKEILKQIGVDNEKPYAWGEIKYLYDPRNLTPQIVIGYNDIVA